MGTVYAWCSVEYILRSVVLSCISHQDFSLFCTDRNFWCLLGLKLKLECSFQLYKALRQEVHAFDFGLTSYPFIAHGF